MKSGYTGGPQSCARSRSRRKPKGFARLQPLLLLKLRARALYSLAAYRRWIRPSARPGYHRLVCMLIAILPGTLLNTAMVLYYSLLRRNQLWLLYMRLSPFSIGRRFNSIASTRRARVHESG